MTNAGSTSSLAPEVRVIVRHRTAKSESFEVEAKDINWVGYVNVKSDDGTFRIFKAVGCTAAAPSGRNMKLWIPEGENDLAVFLHYRDRADAVHAGEFASNERLRRVMRYTNPTNKD